jgi:hypothetical protein
MFFRLFLLLILLDAGRVSAGYNLQPTAGDDIPSEIGPASKSGGIERKSSRKYLFFKNY